MALPMPELPPVTTATRSVRSKRDMGGSWEGMPYCTVPPGDRTAAPGPIRYSNYVFLKRESAAGAKRMGWRFAGKGGAALRGVAVRLGSAVTCDLCSHALKIGVGGGLQGVGGGWLPRAVRLMRCCVLIRRKRAPMALKKRVGGASGVSRMVRILSRMRVISGSRSSMPPGLRQAPLVLGGEGAGVEAVGAGVLVAGLSATLAAVAGATALQGRVGGNGGGWVRE